MKMFATKAMKIIRRRDTEAMNTCKVELFGERALISSRAMLINGVGATVATQASHSTHMSGDGG